MFRRKKDFLIGSKTPDASPLAVSGEAVETEVSLASPLRGDDADDKRSPIGSMRHPDVPRRVRVDLPVITRSHGRPSDYYEGKKLIVGRDIELAGEISACDRLIVEGKVVADLVNTATLEVTRTGIFRGSAAVDHADISGFFDGTLTVRCKLIIRSTGKVCGTIRYARLIVELCGKIHGNVEFLPTETTSVENVCQITPSSAAGENPADG